MGGVAVRPAGGHEAGRGDDLMILMTVSLGWQSVTSWLFDSRPCATSDYFADFDAHECTAGMEPEPASKYRWLGNESFTGTTHQ